MTGPVCWASNTLSCFVSNTSTATIFWSQANPNHNFGSFSVIGVPGMTPGNAWFTSADQQGTTQGALVGYLTPGVQPGANVNAYVFVFGAEQAGGQQYVLVDSCVSTATSPCAIGVGYNAQTQTWQQTFAPDPSVVNGLNVVVLDRVTLTMLQHKTVQSAYDLVSTISTSSSSLAKFSSHAQSLTGNAPASSQVGPYLTDRIVVIMQSVGTGVRPRTAPRPPAAPVPASSCTPTRCR